MNAKALWTVAAGQMALQDAPLGVLAPGNVRLRALHSGVSRGTEALVLAGRVPAALHDTMRGPMQKGDFPFPVQYGYSLVGVVEDGPPSRIGQTCFVLHPHQDVLDVTEAAALPLPQDLPAKRAVLAANMETALNILWDSGAAAGDRVLVVGAGVVGLLTATLIAALPGAEVTVIDTNPARASVANGLGLRFVAVGQGSLPADVDVAINLSGRGEGLQTALDAAGHEAVVVEASWYGDLPVEIYLGGRFHPRRLSLKSSQVGSLPPARNPRWTYRRRLETALRLLTGFPALDALLGLDIPFADAPDRLPALLQPGADALCPVLNYPRNGDPDVRP